MSEHRIVVLENPASVRVDLGRIVIRREPLPDVIVLPADIAVMVLDHHSILISNQALRVLVEGGAVMLVTDAKHMPSGWLSPMWGLPQSASRLEKQIALRGSELCAQLWQRIVQARIATEASNLRHFGANGALRLERMVAEVLPGDSGHHEGQAARHYWRYMFQPGFKRVKQGAEDTLNAALNYGYAILRSMVARELVAASLHPVLGLGHKSTENPFNLADDFLEPFRFVVERHIRACQASLGEFDAATRRCVLDFVKSEVLLGKSRYRLPAAIRETVGSYASLLDSGKGNLVLPS